MPDWRLPEDLIALERILVEEFDRALAGGIQRAGPHLACRRGCTPCCIGPFEVSPLDAARLLEGMAGLAPERAAEIRQRARAQWEMMAAAFPGDAERGILSENEAAREEFFTRWESVPCPALDPHEGACLLYAWRPLSCRSYGLPVRSGREELPPCPLNFRFAEPGAIRAAEVEPDPDDREGALLRALSERRPELGETIMAAVLASAPEVPPPPSPER